MKENTFILALHSSLTGTDPLFKVVRYSTLQSLQTIAANFTLLNSNGFTIVVFAVNLLSFGRRAVESDLRMGFPEIFHRTE